MGIIHDYNEDHVAHEQSLHTKENLHMESVDHLCELYLDFALNREGNPFQKESAWAALKTNKMVQQFPQITFTSRSLTEFSKRLDQFTHIDTYHSTVGPYLTTLMKILQQQEEHEFELFLPEDGENFAIGEDLRGSYHTPVKITLNGPIDYDSLAKSMYMYVIHNRHSHTKKESPYAKITLPNTHTLINGTYKPIYYLSSHGYSNLYFTPEGRASICQSFSERETLNTYFISQPVTMDVFSKIIDRLEIDKQAWKWRDTLDYEGIRVERF